MASEKNIMNLCMVALSKIPGLRCWRNNTGQAWSGSKIIKLRSGDVVRARSGDVLIRDARPIRFGLPGSGDILGLRSVTITPAMVGMTMGQFIAVETKKVGGRQSEQQVKFGAMVNALGGAYVVAVSPDEAVELLRMPGDSINADDTGLTNAEKEALASAFRDNGDGE